MLNLLSDMQYVCAHFILALIALLISLPFLCSIVIKKYFSSIDCCSASQYPPTAIYMTVDIYMSNTLDGFSQG